MRTNANEHRKLRHRNAEEGSETRFPNRIAEHRRAHFMKVAALAERASCTRAHLSKVEAGMRVPSAVLLHDIARVLGVLVDALYDRDWSWGRKKKLHELSGNSATRGLATRRATH